MTDRWPEGCPCGITIESLACRIMELNIRYKLLKIGSSVNMMAAIFKTHIKDFEVQELNSAVNLEIEVTKILVRDIQQEDLDILKV